MREAPIELLLLVRNKKTRTRDLRQLVRFHRDFKVTDTDGNLLKSTAEIAGMHGWKVELTTFARRKLAHHDAEVN